MKKILLIILITFLTSCSKSYVCESNQDIPIYSKQSEISDTLFVVPKNSEVTIIRKSKKFKKIKYLNYKGWTNCTNLIFHEKEKKQTKTANKSYKEKTNTSSGSTVSVKGYYRKDGTYVKPHTRSTPKSSKKR